MRRLRSRNPIDSLRMFDNPGRGHWHDGMMCRMVWGGCARDERISGDAQQLMACYIPARWDSPAGIQLLALAAEVRHHCWQRPWAGKEDTLRWMPQRIEGIGGGGDCA